MDQGVYKVAYWRAKTPKGGLAFAILLACISVLPLVLALAVLFSKTDFYSLGFRLSDPIVYASLSFTIYQAAYSALIVVLFAPCLALALFSMPKWSIKGSILMRIASFCLPSIVVASGLVIAWGNNGAFTKLFREIGVELPFARILYSPHAIIWANSLMSLPFCSVVLFGRLRNLPEEQLRSAEILGLPPTRLIKAVFWPVMRPVLFYFGGLCFLLSMGSFGALSILGSGPYAQTLEMAIYHAIYYSADWEQGGVLTLIHTALCGTFALLTVWALNRAPQLKAPPKEALTGYMRIQSLLFKGRWFMRLGVCLTILFDIFVMSPAFALAMQAFDHIVSGNLTSQSEIVISAIKTSLGFSMPAATVIIVAAWLMSRSYYRALDQDDLKTASFLKFATFIGSMIPPMALGFGFLVLQSGGQLGALRQLVIVSALTSAILPFALSFFMPVYSSRLSTSNKGRLILGISESIFFRKIEWPSIRLSAMISFAFSFALCLNETSVVTILGDATSPALTTTMIRLMNQYRFGDSSIIASLLIIMTLVIVFCFYKSEGVKDA